MRPSSIAPEATAPTHELKVWAQFFDALASGVKSFEYRKDDREPRYAVGDVLRLREWQREPMPPEGFEPWGVYTGREVLRRVTYVARGGPIIPEGYCIMSLEPCAAPPASREMPPEPCDCGCGTMTFYRAELGYAMGKRFNLDGSPHTCPDKSRNLAPRETTATDELIEALDRAAQDYCWERELGPAAIEADRLASAKSELRKAFAALRAENERLRTDYERFERSTRSELAKRDAFLIELQRDRDRKAAEVEALASGKVFRHEDRVFGTEWYIENGPTFASGQPKPFDSHTDALRALLGPSPQENDNHTNPGG